MSSENLDRLHELSDRLTDTEFQLAQANALIAAIFEGADEAILSKDFAGIVTAWNPAAERLYGYSSQEIIGQHISMIVPQSKRPELDVIMANVHEGISTKIETERIRKDGRQIRVKLTVSPIKAANGKIIGASSVAHPANWEWEELSNE